MILGVEGYTAGAKTSTALTAFVAHVQQSFSTYATGAGGHKSCGGSRCPDRIGGTVALSRLVGLVCVAGPLAGLIGPLGPSGVVRAIMRIMPVAWLS